MSQPTFKRIHDIPSLRADVRTNADAVRSIRARAATLTGRDRWKAKAEASGDPQDQRHLILALAYLAGKMDPIARSESPTSRTSPSASSILYWAGKYYHKGPDAEPWDEVTRTPMGTAMGDTEFPHTVRDMPFGSTRYLCSARVTKNAPPGWAEFEARIKADVLAWDTERTLKVMVKDATRTAAKTVSRRAS